MLDNFEKQPTWTVMIYLAGDNNLSADLPGIVEEVLTAEPSKNLKILLTVDTLTAPPLCYRITHNEISITTHTEESPCHALKRLLDEGSEQTDEDDYCALILFGHGPAIGSNNFLKDEHPYGYLTLKDLADTIRKTFNGKPIDVLGLDNCLMSEAEIAYQLRACAANMISSQGMVHVNAWPHREFLDFLAAGSDLTPDSVATRLFDLYHERNETNYKRLRRSADQVHGCPPAIGQVAENEIRALVQVITARLDGLDDDTNKAARALKEALTLARLETQSFWNEQFADLVDFCRLLAKKCAFFQQLSDPGVNLKDVVDACNAVIDALQKSGAAIPHQSYIGPALQYSRGLSVFFPWTMPTELGGPPEQNENAFEIKRRTQFETYLDNDFAQPGGSNWGEFLCYFYAATLRKIRGLPEHKKLNFSARVKALKNLKGKTIGLDITQNSDVSGAGSSISGIGDPSGKEHPSIGGPNGKEHPSIGPDIDHLSVVKNYPRRNYPFTAGTEKQGWLQP